ncbi:MAG: pilus assembly protein PilM [Acidobacteriota bacterium]|nr:pilus assembly protein PilM [Acidobacteriota bacterium]MDH3523654.1 pilus assembly protein PilM [Acidobacteriota bacterium]
MFWSRSKEVVGLDIGSSSIKLVQLKARKNGGYVLQRVGVEPLSQEAIVDGSIMDSSLVVDAITKLTDETGARAAGFATSVSGHSVIIKKIQIPPMSQEELAESIQWEAEQYIPFDINDVRLDYLVLSDGDFGADSMEVLLVAVKRDKVNDYVSVITQSGKMAAIVDLDAFAVQNAYELNYDIPTSKVVALVNMGAAVTTINVLARGQTVFWRDLSIGGNDFTEALQREYSLSFDQAERVKRGEQVEGCSPAEARPVLDAVSADVAAEIQKTFDFFAATAAEDSVSQLVLSGGGSLTPNLQHILEEQFGVPTEFIDPLRRVEFSESNFDGQWLRSIAPTLSVAVGLATRRIGD